MLAVVWCGSVTPWEENSTTHGQGLEWFGEVVMQTVGDLCCLLWIACFLCQVVLPEGASGIEIDESIPFEYMSLSQKK